MTAARSSAGAIRGAGASAAPPAMAPSPSGPRQRWRLYLRLPAASEPGQHPAGAGAWASLLERGGLPLAMEPAKSRVVLAAQLPLGIAGEREILDVVLSTRLPIVDVRGLVRAGLPPGVQLVDLHDIWVGAPSASAVVVSADYRVQVSGVAPSALQLAAEALLAASSLPCERRREKKTQAFDLRPLIVSIAVTAALPPAGAGSVGQMALLRARLRHRPDAVGRAEDLVAALTAPPAPPLDGDLRVLGVVRERLLTGDDT